MYSREIERIIESLTKLPSVGPRAAARFAFYLANQSKKDRDRLVEDIRNLNSLNRCESCFKLSKINPCNICSDDTRKRDLLCVIEKEIDLESIERSNSYRGLYFILGGTVSSLDKESFNHLRAEELLKRAQDPIIKEVILAFNSTVEGDSTVTYLSNKLKDSNKKTSVLGRGISTGGELEYSDPETLSSAFENRLHDH